MKRARNTQRDGTSPLFASIVPGLNRFSQKLFEYLCLEEENNLVISPVGISILLAMVADGAHGQSLAELQSILGLPKSNDTFTAGYKSLIDNFNSLNNYDRGIQCEMHLVSKIVTAESLKIEEKFKDNMSKYFSSEILAMDWTKKDDICEAANKFCKEKTNGRISSILSPPDVPELPSMFLLNAIYLKCEWEEKFHQYFTKSEPFHVSRELEVQVPMMHLTKYYKYAEITEFDASLIILPFKEIRMSMMVFLPNELHGIKELEQYLSTVSFKKLLETSDNRKIHLSLPKFRVEISKDITPTLKKMGLKDVCEMGNADFTGVSSTLPLCIDSVVQKTFLDVNEMRVEAAGVTRLCLRGGGPPPSPPLEFTVNHPFVCAIVAEDYGIPIFMAKIKNPTS